MQPFSYLAPRSRAELVSVLAEHGSDARLMAGGTDVVAELRLSRMVPGRVVDVKRVPEFQDLRYAPDEGLSIGPAVNCARLIADEAVRTHYPVLALAAGKLGSPQLRNRATAVGNICTASPCADIAAALLALEARVEIESTRGVHTVPLRDFFVHVKKTVLRPDEVVTRVVVPAAMAGAVGGMEKLKRIKGHDLALASVVLVKHDGKINVAVGSCAPTPVTTSIDADANVEAVQAAVGAVIRPIDDLRASAEYRRFMVGVYIERLMTHLSINTPPACRPTDDIDGKPSTANRSA